MTATASPETRPAVGSLVQLRGRDWVVLPGREAQVLRLRPLTGVEDEAIGIFLPLEGHALRPARFPPPDPQRAGDDPGPSGPHY